MFTSPFESVYFFLAYPEPGSFFFLEKIKTAPNAREDTMVDTLGLRYFPRFFFFFFFCQTLKFNLKFILPSTLLNGNEYSTNSFHNFATGACWHRREAFSVENANKYISVTSVKCSC